MKKPKIYTVEKAKEIIATAETLNVGGGIQAVIDYGDILNLRYGICTKCNAAMPIVETDDNNQICLCCGQSVVEKEVETLNEDTFFDIYKPILNHIARERESKSVSDEDICSFGGTMFETYGVEFDFIERIANGTKNKHVWTIIDQNDELYCVAGFHTIDRYGYFVTEKSWTSGEETFTFDTEIDE